MLYLAWRQRFGKASPRTDLTNGRQEATKPFFKEIPTPKAASRNLLWNFLHRTTDSSSTGLSPLLQQPEGSPPPATRTAINKPQETNQQTTRPRSTNCPASRTIPCHPRHRAAFAIAAHCISHRNALHKPTQRTAFPEVESWGTDRKHIVSHPALRCHAPHLHPERKRSVPRPPGHAFTPYKDRRPTSRLTSHHKKKQSFT